VIAAFVAWLVAAVPQPAPAAQPFHHSVAPLPAAVRTELRQTKVWRPVCPVSLSGLRVLTMTYSGFDGRPHTGQLIVNQVAAEPLAHVFHRLYEMRFPIHHMQLAEVYGGHQPADGDLTGSFDCRQAVPSPCTGGKGTGSWSMHAYGMAVDVNARENPYVGCGMAHDPATLTYADRSRRRRGMVNAKVIAAFRSIGWGWGGAWPGATHDYMHFSATGH
jgi:hypothetical protein